MGVIYSKVKAFTRKYPGGISWRLKKHCEVAEQHINDDELVIFAFPGQKNDHFLHFFSTCVVVLTNHRILIGQKNLIFGYNLISITPDLFNDLSVRQGLIWGKAVIDTVKEEVVLTNLDKHCLPEIETNITQNMMDQKKCYMSRRDNQ